MLQAIQSIGIPYVVSDLTECSPPARQKFSVEIRGDNELIARFAAEHLAERGLKHFAFCGFSDCAWSSRREKVFSDLLRKEGFSCSIHHMEPESWLHQAHWIEHAIHEQPKLARWLQSLPKPVGVMACNDICGREVLQACVLAGLRVPDEVAVLGVDNDELICDLASPPLSSIALDVESAGYCAARMLDELMCHHRSEEQLVLVKPTYLAERLSTDVVASEDPVVAMALRMIRDESRRGIRVSDVVEKTAVPRRTLERRFTRMVGRSIFEEITRNRLEHAKRLLAETSLACGTIALASGYASVKSFYRAFHRIESVSPGRFRDTGGSSGKRVPRVR